MSAPPPKEVPAHLNCTAKRFVHVVLRAVTRQLRLAGIAGSAQPSLDFHFDAGRSQPEGGGRKVPGDLVLNATEAAASNCSLEDMMACASGIGGLASLEGLGEYLTDSLERGAARPTPAVTSKLGWGPIARSMFPNRSASQPRHLGAYGSASRPSAPAVEPLQLGGGSGAGFQVICGDKGLATLGGGGGGGAFGHLDANATAMSRGNASIGGGGGGGMQFFFPSKLNETPWEAAEWISWSSGGGSGCGSCKPDDEKCAASAHGVTCGAKMDDVGAVDPVKAREVAHLWRTGVLRRCFESGQLAVIGGGGGGAGGAHCCKSVPSLNFGFGFHATLKPQQGPLPAWRGEEPSPGQGVPCCPDLADWNVTNLGQSSSGTGTVRIEAARRLAGAQLAQAGSEMQTALAAIDPFGRENTGTPPPSGMNRPPNLQEMMKQHASRLGVNVDALLNRTRGESCAVPQWLNGTHLDTLHAHGRSVTADGSGTKEPDAALKYILKFNPLQGYLAEGAAACGGWNDWCCLCHDAQWRIACLPADHRSHVEWFLTEDCCESKMNRTHVTVTDVTPARNTSVVWKLGEGWAELPREKNASDSFDWHGELDEEADCTMIDLDSVAAGDGSAAADVADKSADILSGAVQRGNAGVGTLDSVIDILKSAEIANHGQKFDTLPPPRTKPTVRPVRVLAMPTATRHLLGANEWGLEAVLGLVVLACMPVAMVASRLAARRRPPQVEDGRNYLELTEAQRADQHPRLGAYRPPQSTAFGQ